MKIRANVLELVYKNKTVAAEGDIIHLGCNEARERELNDGIAPFRLPLRQTLIFRRDYSCEEEKKEKKEVT